MRDLQGSISATALILAASLNADNTPIAVDLRGFESAVVLINVGAGGITFDAANKIEFVLSHSNDGTNWGVVTASDVQMPSGQTLGAGGVVRALVAAKAAADAAPTEIGYIGDRRYIRLLADFSGAHGVATIIAATAVRGHPHVGPTA